MLKRIFVVFFAVLMFACDKQDANNDEGKVLTQEFIDRMAETLDIQYTVVANKSGGDCTPEWGKGSCFVTDIKITSMNRTKLGGWEIYYSQPDRFTESRNEEFTVTHINGDLVRILPGKNYKGFEAGETKRIRTYSQGLVLTDAKVMPNYYIVAPGLEAKIIQSTRLFIAKDTGLEIRPYATIIDGDTQFQRENDDTPLATAEFLFEQNKDVEFIPEAIRYGVIPRPKKLEEKTGELNLTGGFQIVGDDEAVIAAGPAIQTFRGLGFEERDTGVVLQVSINNKLKLKPGGYALSVGDSISAQGVDEEGVANAVRTLIALTVTDNNFIPKVEIVDEPRYPFRGMHVDLVRNFHSKQFVLSLIEQMAAYKLNKLHLHLGDDEGWRLEIKGLPELTEVGGFRCHDLTETKCLLPQLGSGPDPKQNPEVNGFFSINEYKQILMYADARHIQVIPSFDMPGHSRALIKSMEARYRKLMLAEKYEEAMEYRLVEQQDKTEYRSIQNYNDNTLNVCMASTYHLIDKIIEEMKEVHSAAGQPLTRYHIGADETAGAWVKSPICKDYMKERGIKEAKDLGPHFIERVSKMLDDKNIEVAGWSDGLSHTNFDNMPETVQSNIWDVLVWGGVGNLNKQVNAGWEVVLSTPDALYFDFPHEADPKEPGYYWGTRHVNTKKVFSLMPGNMPLHAEIWKSPSEKPFEIDDTFRYDDKGHLLHSPIQKGKSIVGIQGQIWSETLRSDKWTEYQIYPRLLALAERAWYKPDWEPEYNYQGAKYNHDTHFFSDKNEKMRDRDWNRFASIVAKKELVKLERAGVFYRIPTVGAVIKEGKLYANSIFPGLPIEYQIGNGPWEKYIEPVESDLLHGKKEVRVHSRSAEGKRSGRILSVR
ncbi:family 20 glycosylhydrolase [Teredinibacter sp. KSP-S5-2]|uniref:family 20 glycosylhydrolase n=1 Tax=Teredinibacter sp. KSP-S5-2 TaxID=3034506 RepID=UPI0029349243|nr:family 20 glycosylhydrolase [Teredinibacter sp. KSP-S5-2]WNO11203.1 family 20 glycosylhydrolase [Teredinibacter sp. KSP-S5-2]